MIEVGKILAEIAYLEHKLLQKLNGRVLRQWIDPLCSAHKATKFFRELRSALDEDWHWEGYARNGYEDNPFFGQLWRAIAERP